MAQDAFLTIKQAADRCGVVPLTVRRWIWQGKIAFHQDPTNNVYWIEPKELDRLRTEFNNEKRKKTKRRKKNNRTPK
jgi:excisionase family DNA binding protein